jgi:hypothetical protein
VAPDAAGKVCLAGELRSIGLVSANVIDLLAENTALQNPEAR